MKKYIFVVLCAAFVATGCSSGKKINDGAGTSAAAPADQQDGSSFEKAVVIKEKSEMKGVSAEYAWLRKNYPGYKSNGQSLTPHGNKNYDVIHITTADGRKKDIYFDISNFFGKL
jgi:hypothetical protein